MVVAVVVAATVALSLPPQQPQPQPQPQPQQGVDERHTGWLDLRQAKPGVGMVRAHRLGRGRGRQKVARVWWREAETGERMRVTSVTGEVGAAAAVVAWGATTKMTSGFFPAQSLRLVSLQPLRGWWR